MSSQVTASQVLLWVVEHGDSYPLADDAGDVIDDLPAAVRFLDDGWVNVSKSRFARELRVTRSQLSRWLAAGLPERGDGRLDYWRAWRWVESYKADNHRRQSRGWQE